MGKALTAIGVMACALNAHAMAYDLGYIAGRLERCAVLTEADLGEDVTWPSATGRPQVYLDTYTFAAVESGEASISSWSVTGSPWEGTVFLDVISGNDETFRYNIATRTFRVESGHSYTIVIKAYRAQRQAYDFTLDLPGSFTSAVVPGSTAWKGGAASELGGAFTGESARIYKGRMTAGSTLAGVLEVKTGKAKNGKCKVSAVVTSVTGKKFHSFVQTVLLPGGGALSVDLKIKSLGTLSILVGADGFIGQLGEYDVVSASVGGTLSASAPSFRLDCDLQSIDGNLINRDFLPFNEPVMESNGKWKCRGAAVIGYFHGEWVVQTDSGRLNLSGLKLSYAPKTGVFRGSFKVFALTNKGKPKKYPFKVNGLVVDGIGYALVTRPGSSDTWNANIR